MRHAALALVLAAALPARAADTTAALPARAVGTTAAPAARAADTTIPWDQAEDHVGETVTVEGRVLGIHCSQLSCLLAFDPTFNRFTALIQAEHFNRFPPDQLDALYSGRKVEVHGTITTRDRKPEIELSDPADLKLAEATKDEKKKQAADAADTQAQILDRLDTALANIEALTDRLAAAQDRMDRLIAQLDVTTQALVAAATPPPPPPAPPQASYGEPQPRPGYEALRSVKRGMSANDVRRLVGDPQLIEPSGNGWTTWSYGYGRSVSFDDRGRAQSMTGFTVP